MADLVQTPGTATVNQLRTNTFGNETELKGEVEQATADIAAHKAAGNTDHDGRYSKITDLDTHKTSSDHDGRYYSETEIDAMVVKLTGAQTIAGAKTLTDDLVVKKASPAVELQDAAGNRLAKIVGSTDSDNSALVQVYDTSAGQYHTVLKVQKNGTISDASGNALATKKYAQGLARSGFFMIPLQRYIASAAASTTYPVQDKDSQTLAIQITSGAILKRVRIQWFIGSTSDYAVEETAVSFTDSGYTWLTADVVIGSDDRYMDVKIYGWRMVTGMPTSTLIATVGYAKDDGFATTAVRVAIDLEFSL
jgi:hypothetical protein